MEKSQIQALDRSAPILPMLPGTPQRAIHDYKRSGTSSLYAALDLTSGKVIGALTAHLGRRCCLDATVGTRAPKEYASTTPAEAGRSQVVSLTYRRRTPTDAAAGRSCRPR